MPSPARASRAARSAASPRALATGDGAVLADGAAVAAVSLGIVLAADRLAVMWPLVAAAFAARFAAWARLPAPSRDLGGWRDAAFVAACTALGAFNDWNTVARHRVYDYTVPTDLPGLSPIPGWMLLTWGLVLRFVATLTRWRRLGLPGPGDDVHLGPRAVRSVPARVAVWLALVLGTRQAIYRWSADPWWSWLPFAAALAAAFVLLRFDRRRAVLCAAVMVLGSAVEVLYIRAGGLHAYRLGWLAGVPLWIALWWGLAVLAWDELSWRACRPLAVPPPGAPGRGAVAAGCALALLAGCGPDDLSTLPLAKRPAIAGGAVAEIVISHDHDPLKLRRSCGQPPAFAGRAAYGAQIPQSLPGGARGAPGRAGPCRAESRGARDEARAHRQGDPRLGPASRPGRGATAGRADDRGARGAAPAAA